MGDQSFTPKLACGRNVIDFIYSDAFIWSPEKNNETGTDIQQMFTDSEIDLKGNLLSLSVSWKAYCFHHHHHTTVIFPGLSNYTQS